MVLPITQDNIYATVYAFVASATSEATIASYGHITTWDTSGVTDMSGLFSGTATFNSDIGGWNVSNVTNMNNMFLGAISFNQDLSLWEAIHIPFVPLDFATSATNFQDTTRYPHWGKYRLNVVGNRFLTLLQNSPYTDAGISDVFIVPITTISTVNTAVTGIYTVEYSVTTDITGLSMPSYAIRYITVTIPELILTTSASISYISIITDLSVISCQYSLNGGTSWTSIATSGSSASFALAEAVTYAINDVQVKCTDMEGNIRIIANTTELIIDHTGPTGLVVSFPSSTTPTTVLQISAGVVNISLPSDAVSWKYSLNNGDSWKTIIRDVDNVSYFLLKEGLYAKNTIQVVCTDDAGNDSDYITNGSSDIMIDYKSVYTPELPAIYTSSPVYLTSLLTTLDLTDTAVIGTTVLEQQAFTSNVIRSLFSENTAQNQLVLQQGSILPGFSSSLTKNIYLFSASSLLSGATTEVKTLSFKDILLKNFYVLIESGDSVILQTINDTVTISKSGTTFSLTKNEGLPQIAVIGDMYDYDGLHVALGSIFGTLTTIPRVDFVLSALDSQIVLSESALISGNIDNLICDATINLVTQVSAAVLQSTFFFRTGVNATTTADYYVDTSKWNDLQTTLNPKNGIVGNGGYTANDGVGKDFLRDLARQLFGTYLGADLFINEDTIVSQINDRCDDIASEISTLLTNVDQIIGISTFMEEDEFQKKFLNDNIASPSNISRELLNQLESHAPWRFGNLATQYSYNNTDDGFYKMPILKDDTFTFKLTINPADTQLRFTGEHSIYRTYKVVLTVV